MSKRARRDLSPATLSRLHGVAPARVIRPSGEELGIRVHFESPDVWPRDLASMVAQVSALGIPVFDQHGFPAAELCDRAEVETLAAEHALVASATVAAEREAPGATYATLAPRVAEKVAATDWFTKPGRPSLRTNSEISRAVTSLLPMSMESMVEAIAAQLTCNRDFNADAIAVGGHTGSSARAVLEHTSERLARNAFFIAAHLVQILNATPGRNERADSRTLAALLATNWDTPALWSDMTTRGSSTSEEELQRRVDAFLDALGEYFRLGRPMSREEAAAFGSALIQSMPEEPRAFTRDTVGAYLLPGGTDARAAMVYLAEQLARHPPQVKREVIRSDDGALEGAIDVGGVEWKVTVDRGFKPPSQSRRRRQKLKYPMARSDRVVLTAPDDWRTTITITHSIDSRLTGVRVEGPLRMGSRSDSEETAELGLWVGRALARAVRRAYAIEVIRARLRAQR